MLHPCPQGQGLAPSGLKQMWRVRLPKSLPNPDCLKPPKGAATSVLLYVLMNTVPASSLSLMYRALLMSLVKTPEARPNSVALARDSTVSTSLQGKPRKNLVKEGWRIALDMGFRETCILSPKGNLAPTKLPTTQDLLRRKVEETGQQREEDQVKEKRKNRVGFVHSRPQGPFERSLFRRLPMLRLGNRGPEEAGEVPTAQGKAHVLGVPQGAMSRCPLKI